jgi:hypothetical protein
MRKLARWILLSAATLLLAPASQAAVQLVDADGTLYSVELVATTGNSSPEATALAFTRIAASGERTSGLIDPAQGPTLDQDPTLTRGPGLSGPMVIWSRKNGRFQQIAYSRFAGDHWTASQFLTYSPVDHRHPQVGVDAFGTAYVVWIETGGGGTVMLATFDPLTGNLLSSPRDLFRELVRHSPPHWLSPQANVRGTHADEPRSTDPDVSPEGGIDTPIVPPAPKSDAPVSGTVTLTPACTKVVAAVERNRALWIGILQNGTVLEYYRSVVPEGAPGNYTSLLLQGLWEQHCH